MFNVKASYILIITKVYIMKRCCRVICCPLLTCWRIYSYLQGCIVIVLFTAILLLCAKMYTTYVEIDGWKNSIQNSF